MKSYTIPPEGFNIGSFEIKFYGVIMAFAMLVGVLLSCKLCKKKNIKPDDIILLALFVLPCAVVGARLYYCLFYEENYTFLELFNLREGGLAIYGGVIGGVVGILLFCLVKKDFKLFFKICDIAVPALILGQAIGRWGNFFNQEAYGNLILGSNLKWFPFGVYIEYSNFTTAAREQLIAAYGTYHLDGAWFQATFFYESIWNLVGFFLLLIVYRKSTKTFSVAASYLVWYGVGRFIIEGLRTDSLYLGSTGIRVSQFLSLLLVVTGLTIIIINIIRKVKDGKKV